MIDLDLIKEREKVFEEFRKNSLEMSKVMKSIQNIRVELDNEGNNLRQLKQKNSYLNRLINIMITNDCDPVEAKLKYDEELKESQLEANQTFIDTNIKHNLSAKSTLDLPGEPYV